MAMSNVRLFELYKNTQHSLSMLGEEIKNRDLDWKILADNGLKYMAMSRHQEQHKGSLVNSKLVVDDYLKNGDGF